jgi:capsular exopolysaccharide synthesis family protein
MSRIDEALRRHSTGIAPADRRGALANAEHAACEDVDTTLDAYPRERAIASTSAVRPQAEPIATPVRPVISVHTEAFASPDKRLLVGNGHSPIAIEQYRRLAAAVHELQLSRGLKLLMVTSALPGEGKTLTIANLALTLSDSYGRRVLLIDADLRRPTLHDLLKVPNAVGLNEVLRSSSSELPLVQASPLLSVLPAGRADTNPLAALTSERMRAVLEAASTRFDWVLIDAPPVGIMPDAGLLAGMTGASLLVIAAGSTPHKLVDRAVSELGRDCIVGAVLNRIEEGNIPATGYYRDYYVGSPPQ